jgi:hypothetical protein
MDNTGAWGNNLEVVEGFGAPFEELESFSVAREFKLFIEVLGIVGAGGIDLDRVIDDEVDWAKWVDLGGVSSKTLHGITHGGEINDCWNTTKKITCYYVIGLKKIWYELYLYFKDRKTYVKSCRMTRAGRKGISTSCFEVLTQSRIFSTSFSFTAKSSQLRTADSRSTLME